MVYPSPNLLNFYLIPLELWYTFVLVFFLPCFRYMEEVIESTFSLLSFHHEHVSASPGTEKALEPIHLLALLDIKATWFKKWMVCNLCNRKFSAFLYSLLVPLWLSPLFILNSVSYILFYLVSMLVCLPLSAWILQ